MIALYASAAEQSIRRLTVDEDGEVHATLAVAGQEVKIGKIIIMYNYN